MTTRLKLYNGALRKLKEERLATLTEDIKARRVLDEVYDEAVQSCLEAGQWNWCMRSARLDPDPSIETEYGYQFVYDKPDDWVRTVSLCSDEHSYVPLLTYQEVGRTWLTDSDPIYLQWISNGVDYGLDLGRWPQSFVKFVQTSLAVEVCEDITGSSNRAEELLKLLKRDEFEAKNMDAMNDPVTKFPPVGRLVNSRGFRTAEGRYRAG